MVQCLSEHRGTSLPSLLLPDTKQPFLVQQNARICKTTEFSDSYQQRGKCLLCNASVIEMEFIVTHETEIHFRRQKSCYCNCRLYAQPSAETFSADSNLGRTTGHPHSFFFFRVYLSSSKRWNSTSKLAQTFPVRHHTLCHKCCTEMCVQRCVPGWVHHLTTPRVNSHTSRCNKHP